MRTRFTTLSEAHPEYDIRHLSPFKHVYDRPKQVTLAHEGNFIQQSIAAAAAAISSKSWVTLDIHLILLLHNNKECQCVD